MEAELQETDLTAFEASLEDLPKEVAGELEGLVNLAQPPPVGPQVAVEEVARCTAAQVIHRHLAIRCLIAKLARRAKKDGNYY